MFLRPPKSNTKPGIKKSKIPKTKIKFDPNNYKKIDQFITRKTDTGRTPKSTDKSIVVNTVHTSTSEQGDAVQNTEQHSTCKGECPDMQLTELRETHLTDNKQNSVVHAQASLESPDRSRDYPDPLVSTNPTNFTFTEQSVARESAENITNNHIFSSQDQLAQNPEPHSSRT